MLTLARGYVAQVFLEKGQTRSSLQNILEILSLGRRSFEEVTMTISVKLIIAYLVLL